MAISQTGFSFGQVIRLEEKVGMSNPGALSRWERSGQIPGSVDGFLDGGVPRGHQEGACRERAGDQQDKGEQNVRLAL